MKITIAKKDFGNIKKEKEKKVVKNEKNISTKRAPEFISSHASSHEKTTGDKRKSPTSYILYFVFIVFSIVFFAVVWRSILLYKNSTFKTSSFAVYVMADSPYIISINKEKNEITFIESPKFKEKNATNISYSLGVPIDAKIKKNSSLENLFSPTYVIELLLSFGKSKFEKMTTFDFLEMTIAQAGVSENNRKKDSVEINDDTINKTPDQLSQIFNDADVINEGQSIEIVNSTAQNGLAGRVASLLSPLGVNVVSVSSSEKEAVSQIKAQKKTKTVEKISNILEVPYSIVDELSVSDIQIVLGEDFAKKVLQ